MYQALLLLINVNENMHLFGSNMNISKPHYSEVGNILIWAKEEPEPQDY